KAGLTSRRRPRRSRSPVPALAGLGTDVGDADAGPERRSGGDADSDDVENGDGAPAFDRDEDARALLDDASADAALSRHFAEEEEAEARQSSMSEDDDEDLHHSTEPV